MRKIFVESALEVGIDARLIIGVSKFLQGAYQGFGDKPSAKAAEMPFGIRVGVEIYDLLNRCICPEWASGILTRVRFHNRHGEPQQRRLAFYRHP